MRVVLHAPTADALTRARSNVRNLRARRPEAEILIVVNADGVPAALERRDADSDPHLRICENTLRARNLDAPDDLTTVPAAIETLAQLQMDGWIYVRS